MGHAVILIGNDDSCLRFLNSFGAEWGDNGYFRVQNEKVLRKMKFNEVYCGELTDEEIAAQKLAAENRAKDLSYIVENIPYNCPLCLESSPIQEFTGTIVKATCPKCKGEFKPPTIGDLLI